MARPQNTYRGARRASGHYRPLPGTAYQPTTVGKKQGTIAAMLAQITKIYRFKWVAGKYDPAAEERKHKMQRETK